MAFYQEQGGYRRYHGSLPGGKVLQEMRRIYGRGGGTIEGNTKDRVKGMVVMDTLGISFRVEGYRKWQASPSLLTNPSFEQSRYLKK